jgi:hypothetical protein
MEKNMVEVPENYSMSPEQMAQMQSNPLTQYMRQPSIYIKLPSNGLYYPPGALNLPENKEIPVMPMSTRDEITLNTPDALMNGQGVVDMIHSCCPSIKNAWTIPVVDLDTILIGIRIASYGEAMEYTSTCPKCENADNYEIDLRQFMDMPVNMAIYSQPFEYKGMKVFVQPIDYTTLNKQNLETFEQQRLITMINSADLNAEEKQRRFTEIFQTMTGYTIANIVGSIEKIVTPDGVVVQNESHIDDFVRNADRNFYEALKTYMEEIAKAIPQKIVNTTCAECKEQYSTPFTFDQSNFFAFAS